MIRCAALISGGLDSHLAALLVQQQGVEVEGIHLRTVFAHSLDRAERVAAQLQVKLTTITLGEAYLDLVRRPRFGYGHGASPCLDCRIHMFAHAREFMRRIGAEFVVSGEVVGQRAGSQKRQDLDAISHHSGLGDRLLRPLSATTLVPTLPEREGWVDREKLLGCYGRGRRGLLQLARSLGIDDIPTPSTGCDLTQPPFSRKVFELLRQQPINNAWDFELLTYGRHFRLPDRCKVVIGRHEFDNQQLALLHSRPEAGDAALLAPEGFVGPVALVVGPVSDTSLVSAGRLIQRFAKHPDCLAGRVRVTIRAAHRYFDPAPVDDETAAQKNIADA